MYKLISLLSCLILLMNLAHGQCETCTPDPECVSEVAFPTICPLILPDATAGVAYETILTFFLPATIVDPDSEIEASLDEVIITNVSGLPFGVDYSINSEDNTYHPGEGEEQGCATLCGIPILVGDYQVTITVHVTVTAFGFEQELDQSFQLPLTVLPGEGGNTTFTVDNLAACGTLTVNCEATLNGSPGVTNYNWDFGNGTGSELSNPPAQTYTNPGIYTISLLTEIQDYTLQSVSAFSLADGWGGDIEDGFGLLDPDPYFVITDGGGVNVYTAPYITDVNSGTWDNIGLILDNPPYSITFWDSDDLITDDDYLGTTTFDLATGTALLSAEGTSGALDITLETSALFEETEEVTVFELPVPVLDFNAETAVLAVMDPPLETYTWTNQGDTLFGEIGASIVLEMAGMYQCDVSNEFACPASTEAYIYCPEIELTYDENTQLLSISGGYESYIWSFNGLPIDGASGDSYLADMPGNYAVNAVTDFGCDVGSNVYTVNVGVQELHFAQFEVFPNPVSKQLNIRGPFDGQTQVLIIAMDGKVVLDQTSASNTSIDQIDLHGLEAGTYFLQIRTKAGMESHRIMVVD